MSLQFYPHSEDVSTGDLTDRIDLLLEAAERFKATVLETVKVQPGAQEVKVASPKDLLISFNWEEIAVVLRETRELMEGTKDDRAKKAALLTKLAEVYEVLRAARMSKLEAVRLALFSEANQLRGGTQVA